MNQPATSYERFQMERYGNILPESNRGPEVEDFENQPDSLGDSRDPQDHIEYEQGEDDWFPDTTI